MLDHLLTESFFLIPKEGYQRNRDADGQAQVITQKYQQYYHFLAK